MNARIKDYHTVSEICQLWSCFEEDVIYYAERGQLTLSLLLANRNAWVYMARDLAVGSCRLTGVLSIHEENIGVILADDAFKCRWFYPCMDGPGYSICRWNQDRPIPFDRLTNGKHRWEPIDEDSFAGNLRKEAIFYVPADEVWWWPALEQWVSVDKLTDCERYDLSQIHHEVEPGYIHENHTFNRSDIRITEFHRKTAELEIFGKKTETEPSTPSSDSSGSRVNTIAAERNCQRWLEGLMANKSTPEKAKAGYQMDAGKQFSIGTRAFSRAWSNAIQITRNTNWSRPGRK